LREKELTGIIFLGNKQSGDIFTQEDIDLFLTLTNQASVAIDNAKLYTRMEDAKIYQENILRNLAGGVITIDERGKIVIFNEKAQELTGFSSDAVGKLFKQVVKDPIRKLIEDTLNRDWGYAQQKVDYIKAESVSVPLAVSTTPLKDAAGKISGAVVVLVDLTEIKRLEQELYRAEKLASLGTLAAGMAHEIKNPLVSIKTFLDLLPDKFSDREFREKFSKVAAGEVRRINHIVEQLLDFAHPRPANYQPISIHEVIDGTLTFLSAQLGKKSIKVVKNYARDALQIYADEDKMKQVFLNLFLNGIESMDGGGALTVNTAFRKDGRVFGENELIVEIRDTGEGILPDVLPGIFDPFFSTKKTGTGLGLAMVHRIIIDHGGTVGVKETKVGKGTCFSLNLPVRRENG
jgi:PAS domain S-box-containing protein